jgi:hypothetical protein
MIAAPHAYSKVLRSPGLCGAGGFEGLTEFGVPDPLAGLRGRPQSESLPHFVARGEGVLQAGKPA